MMCSRRCKQELDDRNLGFVTSDPWIIVSSQWPKFPKWLYVAWRVLVAIYHVVWCIVSGTEGNGIEWLILLSNWQYALITFSLVVQASVTVVCHVKESLLEGGEMTWYLGWSWLMDATSNTFSFVVGVIYWGLVYTPSNGINAVDLNMHGITLLYLAINICITGIPTRVYHFIYAVSYGAIYIIVSVVYYYAGGLHTDGGTAIYSFLDWTHPGSSALYVIIVGLVCTPICHFILYGIYGIRMLIYNRYKVQPTEGYELEHAEMI